MTNYFLKRCAMEKTIMQSHIITTLRSCKSKHQGFGKRKKNYPCQNAREFNQARFFSSFHCTNIQEKVAFLTLVGHGS
jgi:hypothetical protein